MENQSNVSKANESKNARAKATEDTQPALSAHAFTHVVYVTRRCYYIVANTKANKHPFNLIQ